MRNDQLLVLGSGRMLTTLQAGTRRHCYITSAEGRHLFVLLNLDDCSPQCYQMPDVVGLPYCRSFRPASMWWCTGIVSKEQ